MFREMRRKRQALSQEECVQILKDSTSGVLAVSGDEGYPYAVPISYVYDDGRLFFHSAREGHKIDGIQRNERVSFCVIQQDQVIPETLTTHFRSVVLFGRARFLEEEVEKRRALELLAGKYSPGEDEAAQKSIAQDLKRVVIVELRIEHLSGKQAIELVRQKTVP